MYISWGGVRNIWCALCFSCHWLQPLLLLQRPALCCYLVLGYFWILVPWCRSVQALLLLSISCQGMWGILRTSAPKQSSWRSAPLPFTWLSNSGHGYVLLLNRKKMLKYSSVTLFSLLFQFEEVYLETKEQYDKLIKGKNPDTRGLVLQNNCPAYLNLWVENSLFKPVETSGCTPCIVQY